MDNFNFDLSVSLQQYARKEDADLTQRTGIRYTPQTISLDYLRNLVKQGHWFCHIFNTKDNPFGTGEKKNENFNHAQMIFFDIDDSKISMYDFLAQSSKHPSICYNTANNEKNGLYRFRLGYLLEQPIYDYEHDFPNAYDAIKNNIILKDMPQIETYLENDECGREASRQFAGNANGKENCMIFHNIFSFDEIGILQSGSKMSPPLNFESGLQKNKKQKKEENVNPNNENNKVTIRIKDFEEKDVVIEFEKDFYTDFWRMNDLDIITKYQEKYNYFDRTDLQFNEEGFALLGNDYMEVKRTWNVKKTYNDDGTIKYQTKRIHDKEKRRRKLFLAGMVMKKINPNISATHLLYNMVCELKYYYDNSEDSITRNDLFDKVKDVYKYERKFNKFKKCTNKKFVISKKWCRKNNISATSRANEVRKILNFQKIGEIYDVSLSVKDNLQIFKELGIKTSQRTLYNFCKENNISTKGEKA